MQLCACWPSLRWGDYFTNITWAEFWPPGQRGWPPVNPEGIAQARGRLHSQRQFRKVSDLIVQACNVPGSTPRLLPQDKGIQCSPPLLACIHLELCKKTADLLVWTKAATYGRASVSGYECELKHRREFRSKQMCGSSKRIDFNSPYCTSWAFWVWPELAWEKGWQISHYLHWRYIWQGQCWGKMATPQCLRGCPLDQVGPGLNPSSVA